MQCAEIFDDAVKQHAAGEIADYLHTARRCHNRLREIWTDLEVSAFEQEELVKNIACRAVRLWCDAVASAERQHEVVVSQLQDAAAEIRQIAAEMGELSSLNEANLCSELECSEVSTTKKRLDMVVHELEDWSQRKDARIAECTKLSGHIQALRESLGIVACTTAHSEPAITRGNIDFLKLELERLRGEQVRRQRRIEGCLARMRKLCVELGHDDQALAVSVNPLLLQYLQSKCSQYDVYHTVTDLPVSTTCFQDVLSDEVFLRLDSRVNELLQMRKDRDVKLKEVEHVLNNMWGMLEVAPGDVNRKIFERILRSPARLHQHTIAKCHEEIHRLEAEQAKVMREMIAAKVIKIKSLCDVTFLPMPDVSVLLADADSPGHVAEVLSKVVRMLAEITNIVHEREPVVKAIVETEECFKEVHWLFHHQQANLFNNRGRDANRVLQRAIRAEEKKKRLPKLICKLSGLCAAWKQRHGRSFMFGQFDYELEILALINSELRSMTTCKKSGKETDGRKRVDDMNILSDKADDNSSEALNMMMLAHDCQQQCHLPPLVFGEIVNAPRAERKEQEGVGQQIIQAFSSSSNRGMFVKSPCTVLPDVQQDDEVNIGSKNPSPE